LNLAIFAGSTSGCPEDQRGVVAAVRASLNQGVGMLKTTKLCGCGVSTATRIKAEIAAIRA
jgi:hypothetical protein